MALAAMSIVAILPSTIVVELTDSAAKSTLVAVPVKAPAKTIVPEVVVVAKGVKLAVS